MRQQCIAAVSRALGRAITKAEAENIEGRMLSTMRQLAKRDRHLWASYTPADRFQLAATEAAQQLVHEAIREARHTALTVAAQARVRGVIAQAQGVGISSLEALSRVMATYVDGRLDVQSVESQAKAIRNDTVRRMLRAFESTAPRFFGLLADVEGERILQRELSRESTGNSDAAIAAKVFHDTVEQLRQRWNRAGGDTGFLEDWDRPHAWFQRAVAYAAGKDVDAASPKHRMAFIADVVPRLDRSKYVNEDGSLMSDVQVADFVGHAWLSIATGGLNKQTPGQFRGVGARANRGMAHRQLHWATADDYMAMHAKYGQGSIFDAMVGHVSALARDIAMVETLGPNPDHTFQLLLDDSLTIAAAAEPGKLGDLQNKAETARSTYDYIAGRTLPVANWRMAEGFDTLRNWLVASKLGSAVITSFSDEATMRLVAKVNQLPQLRLMANELAALDPTNPVERRMAMRAGLALNTFLDELSRFGQEGLGSSWSRKLASASLRVSGLQALTEARRRAFGVTMMGSVGDLVSRTPDLRTLDPQDYRFLLSKGITDTDWQVMRKAVLEDWGNGNNTMLTPDAIARIPDSALVAMGDPQALREQAITRFLGAVLEETDVAIIEPGARERIMMGGAMQRGTVKGELVRSFFLFKSFPLAMLTRHWSRALAMPNLGGKAGYLAMHIAGTSVMGLVSLQISELLAGRDPRNLTGDGSMRTYFQAAMKGGAWGLYGDYLFSERSQYNRSLIADLAGPVPGILNDIDNLTRANVLEAMAGKETNAGAEAVRFVRGNTPMANLWYTKAAMDHLIWNQLQEMATPGYMRRMKARAKREFGQTYWWDPADRVPDRAPDLDMTQ